MRHYHSQRYFQLPLKMHFFTEVRGPAPRSNFATNQSILNQAERGCSSFSADAQPASPLPEISSVLWSFSPGPLIFEVIFAFHTRKGGGGGRFSNRLFSF